jgi:hypothetical protein
VRACWCRWSVDCGTASWPTQRASRRSQTLSTCILY